MRIVITGSAGFLGSNLTERCLNLGWNVVGIDNFATGAREMATASRFSNTKGKYTFVEGDINNLPLLCSAFKDCDIIFHLAALPRVQYSTDFPLESNMNNINGTVNVLEAAKICKVKRVVYSASSSMYGGKDIPFPTSESTPAHPRSNYALQKYTGLEYCRLYNELYDMDTVSLIYFNLFGPYQRTGGAYSTVIPAFISNALNGKSCRIDGKGDQRRDFCYVDNVVQANILAATHTEKLMGDRFNVACGESYTVNQVFESIQELLGKKLEAIHAPPRLGDPLKSLADISKAQKVLGYEPKVKFAEGMKLTVAWWLKGCQASK